MFAFLGPKGGAELVSSQFGTCKEAPAPSEEIARPPVATAIEATPGNPHETAALLGHYADLSFESEQSSHMQMGGAMAEAPRGLPMPEQCSADRPREPSFVDKAEHVVIEVIETLFSWFGGHHEKEAPGTCERPRPPEPEMCFDRPRPPEMCFDRPPPPPVEMCRPKLPPPEMCFERPPPPEMCHPKLPPPGMCFETPRPPPGMCVPKPRRWRRPRPPIGCETPTPGTPGVIDDPTPVVDIPPVIDDPTPVVDIPPGIDDPTPVVDIPPVIDDPTPVVDIPPVIDDPTPTTPVVDTPPVIDDPTPTTPVIDDPTPTTPVIDDPTPTPTTPVIDDPTPTPTTPVIDDPTPTTPVIDDPTPTPTTPVIDDPTPTTPDPVTVIVTPPGCEPTPVTVTPDPVDQPPTATTAPEPTPGTDTPPVTVVVPEPGCDSPPVSAGPIDQPPTVVTTGPGCEPTPAQPGPIDEPPVVVQIPEPGCTTPDPVPVVTAPEPTTPTPGPVDSPDPVTVVITPPGCEPTPVTVAPEPVEPTPAPDPDPVTVVVAQPGCDPTPVTVTPAPIDTPPSVDTPTPIAVPIDEPPQVTVTVTEPGCTPPVATGPAPSPDGPIDAPPATVTQPGCGPTPITEPGDAPVPVTVTQPGCPPDPVIAEPGPVDSPPVSVVVAEPGCVPDPATVPDPVVATGPDGNAPAPVDTPTPIIDPTPVTVTVTEPGCEPTPVTVTPAPSDGPTNGPTAGPVDGPTNGPTAGPVDGPTNGPTAGPVDGPTNGPTAGPVDGPTNGTHGPVDGPTNGPHGPVDGPTNGPVDGPTGPTMVNEPAPWAGTPTLPPLDTLPPLTVTVVEPGCEPTPVTVTPAPVDGPTNGTHGPIDEPGPVQVTVNEPGCGATPVDSGPAQNPPTTTEPGQTCAGPGDGPTPIVVPEPGNDPTPIIVNGGPVDEPTPVAVVITPGNVDPGQIEPPAPQPGTTCTTGGPVDEPGPVDAPTPITVTVTPPGCEPTPVTVLPTPTVKPPPHAPIFTGGGVIEPIFVPDPQAATPQPEDDHGPPTAGATTAEDPPLVIAAANSDLGVDAITGAAWAPAPVASRKAPPGDDDGPTEQQNAPVVAANQDDLRVDAVSGAAWAPDTGEDGAAAGALVAATIGLVESQGDDKNNCDEDHLEGTDECVVAPRAAAPASAPDAGSWTPVVVVERAPGDVECQEAGKPAASCSSPVDEITRLHDEGHEPSKIAAIVKTWRFDRPARDHLKAVRGKRKVADTTRVAEDAPGVDDAAATLGLGAMPQLSLRDSIALDAEAQDDTSVAKDAGTLLAPAAARDALLRDAVHRERASAEGVPAPRLHAAAVVDENNGAVVSYRVGPTPVPTAAAVAVAPAAAKPAATHEAPAGKVQALEDKISGDLKSGKPADPSLTTQHRAAVVALTATQNDQVARIQSDLAQIDRQLAHADSKERAELTASRERLMQERATVVPSKGAEPVAVPERHSVAPIVALRTISPDGQPRVEITYGDGVIRVVDRLTANPGRGGDALDQLLPLLPAGMQLRPVLSRGKLVSLDSQPSGFSIPAAALASLVETSLPRMLLEHVPTKDRAAVVSALVEQGKRAGVEVDPRPLLGPADDLQPPADDGKARPQPPT